MDVSENEVIIEPITVSDNVVVIEGDSVSENVIVSDHNIITISDNIVATVSSNGDIFLSSVSDNEVPQTIEEITQNYYEFTVSDNAIISEQLETVNISLTILIGVTIYFGLRASIKKFVRRGYK